MRTSTTTPTKTVRSRPCCPNEPGAVPIDSAKRPETAKCPSTDRAIRLSPRKNHICHGDDPLLVRGLRMSKLPTEASTMTPPTRGLELTQGRATKSGGRTGSRYITVPYCGSINQTGTIQGNFWTLSTRLVFDSEHGRHAILGTATHRSATTTTTKTTTRRATTSARSDFSCSTL